MLCGNPDDPHTLRQGGKGFGGKYSSELLDYYGGTYETNSGFILWPSRLFGPLSDEEGIMEFEISPDSLHLIHATLPYRFSRKVTSSYRRRARRNSLSWRVVNRLSAHGFIRTCP